MEVEVVWHEENGELRGWVEVVNDDAEVLRLRDKPSIRPLAVDGSSLQVPHLTTLEMQYPGFVDLLPGQRARAPITWHGWDGPAAGGLIVVEWPDPATRGDARARTVQTTVAVRGPRQPTGTAGGSYTSSSWFELLP